MQRLSQLFALGLLLVPALPLAAQEEFAVVDRILAVVDEDPILASEVERVIGLGLIERRAVDESEQEYRRHILEQLIDQRLRFHEIDRFGFAELPIEEVERQLAAFRQRFASQGEFERRLAELGMDVTTLKQLVARQVMVVTYVEERLGPRVFVGLEDINAYYQNVLAAEMKARGEPLPAISEVREQIRSVLKQERLNREIERWTEELRQKAEIEDYSMSGHDTPPGAASRSGIPDSGF